MGDVIVPLAVRSDEGEQPRRLRLYFDSGSPYTFIRESMALLFKNCFSLAKPKGFGGLGNGRFEAAHFMPLEVRLLGFWCAHAAYVVGEDVLEPGVDVLVGHGFMQNFNVSLNMRRRKLILDKNSLRMAQRVHRANSRELVQGAGRSRAGDRMTPWET